MSAFDELRMSAPDVEAALREQIESIDIDITPQGAVLVINAEVVAELCPEDADPSEPMANRFQTMQAIVALVNAALAASRTAETGEPEKRLLRLGQLLEASFTDTAWRKLVDALIDANHDVGGVLGERLFEIGELLATPPATTETETEYYGIPGHCFDIDGDRWHEPGECKGAAVNCDGECCGYRATETGTDRIAQKYGKGRWEDLRAFSGPDE